MLIQMFFTFADLTIIIVDQSCGKVARQCSIQYNPNHPKNTPEPWTKSSERLHCLVLLPLYLSLREEGAFLQVTMGLHGLLKLTSDVVLTRARDSLMESRQQEKYSKY